MGRVLLRKTTVPGGRRVDPVGVATRTGYKILCGQLVERSLSGFGPLTSRLAGVIAAEACGQGYDLLSQTGVVPSAQPYYVPPRQRVIYLDRTQPRARIVVEQEPPPSPRQDVPHVPDQAPPAPNPPQPPVPIQPQSPAPAPQPQLPSPVPIQPQPPPPAPQPQPPPRVVGPDPRVLPPDPNYVSPSIATQPYSPWYIAQPQPQPQPQGPSRAPQPQGPSRAPQPQSPVPYSPWGQPVVNAYPAQPVYQLPTQQGVPYATTAQPIGPGFPASSLPTPGFTDPGFSAGPRVVGTKPDDFVINNPLGGPNRGGTGTYGEGGINILNPIALINDIASLLGFTQTHIDSQKDAIQQFSTPVWRRYARAAGLPLRDNHFLQFKSDGVKRELGKRPDLKGAVPWISSVYSQRIVDKFFRGDKTGLVERYTNQVLANAAINGWSLEQLVRLLAAIADAPIPESRVVRPAIVPRGTLRRASVPQVGPRPDVREDFQPGGPRPEPRYN